MWQGPATLTTALAGVGLTWLVQSTVVLALGLLLAGMAPRKRGRSRRCCKSAASTPATTRSAAVLVCPFASVILTATGYDGLAFQAPAHPDGAGEARGGSGRTSARLPGGHCVTFAGTRRQTSPRDHSGDRGSRGIRDGENQAAEGSAAVSGVIGAPWAASRFFRSDRRLCNPPRIGSRQAYRPPRQSRSWSGWSARR